jgi:hypothetical protein
VVENIGERVVDAPTVWDFYILHKGGSASSRFSFFRAAGDGSLPGREGLPRRTGSWMAAVHRPRVGPAGGPPAGSPAICWPS